jgi:hypothetical protein
MFVAQHIEMNMFYWVLDSNYITWITSECSIEYIITVKSCNNIIFLVISTLYFEIEIYRTKYLPYDSIQGLTQPPNAWG